MGFFILIGLFLLTGVSTICLDKLPPTYDFSFPYDYGAHLNYSYEYWWYGGYLFGIHPRDNTPKTFGFLFGPTRCSKECNTWNDNMIINSVTITVVEDASFEYSSNFSVNPTPEMWYSIDPYTLNFETYQVTSKYPDLEETLLQGTLGTTELFLFLQGSPPISIIDPDNQEGTGIHLVQNLLIQNGWVTYQNLTYNVWGYGFLDHFWSTSSCGTLTHAKWRWFLLTFDIGIQVLVYYQEIPRVTGSLFVLYPNGTSERFTPTEFTIVPLQWWTNPHNHLRYPHTSNITIPTRGWFYVETIVADNTLYLDRFVNETLLYEGSSKAEGVWDEYFGILGWGTSEVKQPFGT